MFAMYFLFLGIIFCQNVNFQSKTRLLKTGFLVKSSHELLSVCTSVCLYVFFFYVFKVVHLESNNEITYHN